MEGESLVAISTCDGIRLAKLFFFKVFFRFRFYVMFINFSNDLLFCRGIIQVKNESYVIQPLTMIHDGNYVRAETI